MNSLVALFDMAVDFMKIRLNLFGYDISLYSLFIFVVIGSFLAWVFFKLFDIISG